MRAIFATLLLVLCLQGTLAFNNKGPKKARNAMMDSGRPMNGTGRPMNGSWITAAGLFQGDIKLTPEQERQLTERQGITNTNDLWPKNPATGKVVVPYTMVHTGNQKTTIERAMATYAAATCYEFVERTNENDYIQIISDGGCWSYVGKTGGPQQLSLDRDGCVYDYIVIHELMHAVGFYHEQSRYDRDNYITINWDNICCNAAGNFFAETSANTQLHNQPYDYKSVMHYGEYDFSVNGEKVIEANDGTSPLGNSVGLTQIDINKNLHLYSCEAGTTDPTTATTEPTGTTEVTDEPTTEDPSSCEDNFGRLCTRLANRGRCTNTRDRAFMVENCASSCGECDTTWCYDSYPMCKMLARRGYCNKAAYEEWMFYWCPDSCGVECDNY